MQTFIHESTRYTVNPENVTKYRALIEKPKKHKCEAHKAPRRQYPAFKPGMTTAEYVSLFNSQNEGLFKPFPFDCANYHNAAPMLDASYPECIEDENPDYMPSIEPVKQKRTSSKELKGLIEKALELLSLGDVSASQSLLKMAI
jgi:hypothetical protein